MWLFSAPWTPSTLQCSRCQTCTNTDGQQVKTSTQFIMKNLFYRFTSSLFAAFVFAMSLAHAADMPYNESADAKAEVKLALTKAAADKVPVLLVFGANWCGDCKVLDSALKSGSAAPLAARDFRIVKIDVGRFNKNTDIAQMYGVPLKKGIPAVAIVSANADASQNKVLYVTKAGELADARNMGDKGIYDFFKRVSADTKPKS
jgi:thioredoxin 1